MSDETVMPRVTAAPLPERVVPTPMQHWYLFYNLIDTHFFGSILKGDD
jgi:hypothetical protein